MNIVATTVLEVDYPPPPRAAAAQTISLELSETWETRSGAEIRMNPFLSLHAALWKKEDWKILFFLFLSQK